MLAFNYWIKKFVAPSLASLLEEREDLVLVESLCSFWSLFKAFAGFFLLMAKISAWLKKVLDDES